MLWPLNYSNSNMDDLLERKDVTLIEVLSEESVVTEVQSYNEKLLEFLLSDENLTDMLNILTTTPHPNRNGIIYFTHQNTISDILSSFVSNVYETMGNDKYLFLLFKPFFSSPIVPSEIDDEPNPNHIKDGSIVNSVTCSLVLKVAKMLCQQCSIKMLNFLLDTHNILDRFIVNIENYSVTEFILKCIQSFPVEEEVLNHFFQWLSDQRFVDKVLAQISVDIDKEQQSIKSFQTLVEVLLAVRQTKESDPLREDIESSKVVNTVLTILLEMPNDRCNLISTGFDFLKAIFEVPDKSVSLTYGCVPIYIRSKCSIMSEELQSNINVFNPIIDSLVVRFGEFKRILEFGSLDMEIKTVYGGIIKPPLGPHRLSILELLLHLVKLEQQRIYYEILNCDIIAVLLQLTITHFLNTFLHRIVMEILIKLISYSFENGSSENCQDISSKMIHEIFINRDLLSRIMSGWMDTRTTINESLTRVRNVHRPFMGTVANKVVKYNDILEEYVKDEDLINKWKLFCENNLNEYNRLNESERKRTRSNSSNGSYIEILTEDNSKAYDDCLNQKITEDFPDYCYQPFSVNSNNPRMDLNANPLLDMFIATPEDRENAETFEFACNFILQAKMRKDDNLEVRRSNKESGDSGTLVSNEEPTPLLNVFPVDDGEVDADELSIPKDIGKLKLTGNDESDENMDVQYSSAFFRTSSLSSAVIDDLFKEAYKDKIAQTKTKINKSEYGWSAHTPLVPKLNLNSIHIDSKDNADNNFKLLNDSNFWSRREADRLYKCDEKDELEESNELNVGVSRGDATQVNISGNDDVEYADEYADEYDEDDDFDMPLSSRLEKESVKRPENLSMLENGLNNRTWNNPSIPQTENDNDMRIDLDIVEDVTPSVEHTSTFTNFNPMDDDGDCGMVSSEDCAVPDQESALNVPESPRSTDSGANNRNNKVMIFESSKSLTLSDVGSPIRTTNSNSNSARRQSPRNSKDESAESCYVTTAGVTNTPDNVITSITECTSSNPVNYAVYSATKTATSAVYTSKKSKAFLRADNGSSVSASTKRSFSILSPIPWTSFQAINRPNSASVTSKLSSAAAALSSLSSLSSKPQNSKTENENNQTSQNGMVEQVSAKPDD